MREFEESTLTMHQPVQPLFGFYDHMFSPENYRNYRKEDNSEVLFMDDTFLTATAKTEKISRHGTDFRGQSPDPNDLHTGRQAVGQAILDSLDDWNWLIKNKGLVQQGLEWAYGHMTPDAFEKFVAELGEKSGGKIYMEKGNGLLGSLNPLNPSGDSVRRLYLKRGGILTDKIMDSRKLTLSPTYNSGGKTHDSAKR